MFSLDKGNLLEWVRIYLITLKYKKSFKQANDSLGFDITRIMFEGEKEELTRLKLPNQLSFTLRYFAKVLAVN